MKIPNNYSNYHEYTVSQRIDSIDVFEHTVRILF